MTYVMITLGLMALLATHPSCLPTHYPAQTSLLNVKIIYLLTNILTHPEQKQAPPFRPQRHARHRQVALYLAPEADTGMVCGKHQVRQQSEPWGTRRIQTTSTLTVLNLVK